MGPSVRWDDGRGAAGGEEPVERIPAPSFRRTPESIEPIERILTPSFQRKLESTSLLFLPVLFPVSSWSGEKSAMGPSVRWDDGRGTAGGEEPVERIPAPSFRRTPESIEPIERILTPSFQRKLESSSLLFLPVLFPLSSWSGEKSAMGPSVRWDDGRGTVGGEETIERILAPSFQRKLESILLLGSSALLPVPSQAGERSPMGPSLRWDDVVKCRGSWGRRRITPPADTTRTPGPSPRCRSRASP